MSGKAAIERTNQNPYGRKQITLPVPKLVTFYNGTEDQPDRELRLRDSFPKGVDPDQSDVDVRVHMFNVRPQYQSHLLVDCKSLNEYSWFVEEVRKNQETMELISAVDKAIEEMPEDCEIKGFLQANRSEVKNMCLTEYDEAKTMGLFKKEGREDHLVRQVCRKLRKGKPADLIADELEEDISVIKPICEELARFAPDFDEEKASAEIRQFVVV